MKLEEKLSRMIQCETVSQAGVDNSAKFLAFHEVLRQLFPNVFAVFAHCQIEKFGQALLVRWQGKTNHDQPIILMSHQDVVEASGKWSHEPFSGDIADGRVWGRGTVDTKGSLMCIFEALDRTGIRTREGRLHLLIRRRGGQRRGGTACGEGPRGARHKTTPRPGRGRHDQGRAHKWRQGALRDDGHSREGNLQLPLRCSTRHGRTRLRTRQEHPAGKTWGVHERHRAPRPLQGEDERDHHRDVPSPGSDDEGSIGLHTHACEGVLSASGEASA